MDSIRTSINNKAKALRNFCHSFYRRDDAVTADPRDVLDLKGPEEKDWTVLVYAEGRNRMAYSTNLALNMMEHIGSDDRVNIVAQATVEPAWNERFAPGMERVNTRRYYIVKDNDREKITSPVVGDLGEKVALDSGTMADFVAWGMKEFPAKHYMVIIKKHGLGFAKTDKFVPLSARDLGKALETVEQKTGKKVDVLSFDSCSMQMMEVGYEIKDRAKVMTASQEDVFAADYPYDRVLWGIEHNASCISPREVGELVVEAHRQAVPEGIQTAADLQKLGEAGGATRLLVKSIIDGKVPREIIYTAMLKSPSMEPQNPARFAFNFRDEMAFLDTLIDDQRIASPEVKKNAEDLKQKLSDCIIDHHLGERKKRIKDARGLSLFMPWKNPSPELADSYKELAFSKDSCWNELIGYVFQNDGAPGTSSQDSSSRSSLHLSAAQKIGRTVIGNYKKYVSPYLMTACKHTPSCSQYGREAIEKHGLFHGGKMGFMRVLSCNDEAHARIDPVPDPSGCTSPATVAQEAIPDILITPPDPVPKSRMRRNIESGIILMARSAARMLGGLAGALAAIPIGVAMGTVIAVKAGTNTIDAHNRKLLTKYNTDSVRQFVKIEHALGDAAYATYGRVKSLTSAESIARVIGGATGLITGGALGMLGGAAKGYAWGSKFAGLFAENYLKERFGELPRHPETEKILNHYYQ